MCLDWILINDGHGATAIMTLSVSCLADVARAIELLERLQRAGDVPAQKIQALQKVLQSDFCTAVREVTPSGGHLTHQHSVGFVLHLFMKLC